MYYPHGFDAQVFRKPKADNWGSLNGVGDTTGIPALYGRLYSHTLYDVTVGPRVDEDFPKKDARERTSYTGATLFCEIDDDVQSDDLIVWTDDSGKRKIYVVEGIGEADFISPFSGFGAGKEVYIGVYRHRR